jgi:hypothetical protein
MNDEQLKEKHETIISRLKLDKQIFIYSNQLCISSHTGNKLIWVRDYYNYKFSKDDDYDNLFHINLCEKKLKKFSDKVDDDYKTKLYYGFLNTIQFIDDTFDENLGKIHLELLKKRLIDRVVQTVSNQDIISRETQHMKKIIEFIDNYIKQLSLKIYSMVENGIEVLHIKFNEIDEKTITSIDKIPRFKEHPCSDGKLRQTFSEYFYFLLENEYSRKPDDLIDQEWAGRYLVQRCNTIFPHIKFTCKYTDTLLPIVILNLDIDTSDSLL